MKKIINELEKNIDKILYIHYSCENLSDNNEGLSPRITSIAVYFHDESALKSFAFNIAAEKLHIKRNDIENNLNAIEKKLLEDFFEFVNDHYDFYWVHWNMSNMNFGFDALEHRYEVLNNKRAKHIPEEKRFNLSKLIALKYGSNYADDPKMKNLMLLNWDKLPRDFLDGKEEVEAFNNKDYIKMHKSTISKVRFFRYIFIKLIHNEIKTKKKNWKLIFKELFEKPFFQILSISAMFVTIISAIIPLIKWCITLINE